MSTDTASPRKSSNVGLIVSLCINLILVGVIAMGFFRAFHPGLMFGGQGFGRGMGQGQGALAPYALMRLVPAESDKIQSIVAAHRDRILQFRSEAMAARQETRRAFADANFSRQAFDRSLERVRNADMALEEEEMKVMSESVAALTPDERRAVVDRVRAHRGFEMRRRGAGQGF